MIPMPLAGPSGGTRPRSRHDLVRVGSLVLFLVAVTGAMAWSLRLSPFQLDRWPARDTSHAVTFTEPGTYVLFEEGAGAASRRGDAEVIASVRSIAGRSIPLRSLIDDRGRSTQTYNLGVREGRAIAAIDVDRPGRYVVVSFAAAGDPLDPRHDRDRSELPGLALGPEGVPSPWGTWLGLVLVAGTPAALGAVLLIWARARHPLPLGPVEVETAQSRRG